MDCEDVGEMLDAYALGAAASDEAEAVERHVAGCVRCWDELNETQRTAALLALSVPLREAPERLRRRIMSEAERERRRATPSGARTPTFGRLRPRWTAAVGALGLVGVAAALAFAVLLQFQVDDLQRDKDSLTERLSTANEHIRQQAAMISVVSAADAEQVSMVSAGPGSDAWGTYTWSRSNQAGFIVCHGMPSLAANEVYQVWLVAGGEAFSVGMLSRDGEACEYPMSLTLTSRPEGIGISREKVPGSTTPTGPMVLYADLGGGD